jgi:hypothetical protein
LGNLAFNVGVKVVQGGSRLSRLTQDVAPAEAGEIIGRIVKTKLVNRVVGTE